MLNFFFYQLVNPYAFITKYKIPFTHSNVNVTILFYSCHLSQLRSNISLAWTTATRTMWQSIAPNEPAFNDDILFDPQQSPGVVYDNPKKMKPLDLCKTLSPLTLCRTRQPPVV